MHVHPLKTAAIKLRLRGNTYSDINKKLKANISKSTMSGWFKPLVLSYVSKKRLKSNIERKLKKSQLEAYKTNRRKRLYYLESLKSKNLYLLNSLDLSVQKLILCTLYLAEGSKNKNSAYLGLGSTNPAIIKFYLSLLNNCFKIDNSKFRARIQCRADQNKKSLENFWRNITGVPSQQFYPTYIDQRTVGKKTLKKG